MKRRMVMGLLALGVVGGYGSAIAHWHCGSHWREQHRAKVMGEFARTCVEAARADQVAGTPRPAVAPYGNPAVH